MASKALTLRKRKNRKMKKVHGFLGRMRTAGGRATILARRRKGRNKISV
ncbi:MAG: ribosomal protein L34 [Crocinitomicaceae bacterium]|jgi:ribosomal protein L34